MAEIKSLQDLLNLEIQMLYSAEKQVLAALPRLARKAQSHSLNAALQRQLSETRTRRERLKQIAELLRLNLNAEPNQAMKCLFAESEELWSADLEAGLQDAVLNAVARKISHYKISGYRTAAFLATELGHAEVAGLLEMNLAEEETADSSLDALVPFGIYVGAA